MERSISDVVNEAVRQMLSEDESDLEMFEKRRHEPNLDFDSRKLVTAPVILSEVAGRV